MLILSGDNAYTGGTVVEGGALVADGRTALGDGEVYVSEGTLDVAGAGLTIGGDFTVLADGTVSIAAKAGDVAAIEVNGAVTLAGGTLDITTDADAEGVTLIAASSVTGTFDTVRVNGEAMDVVYAADSITLAAQ